MRSRTSGGEDTGSGAQRSDAQTIAHNLAAPCPKATVSLGDVPVNLLLDTGSMVTTIFESFFLQNFQSAPRSCRWRQLCAANGLEIPYVGYVELDMTVFGKVIPQRRILVIKDPPGQTPPANFSGVLGMNVIRECYHQLFGQHSV